MSEKDKKIERRKFLASVGGLTAALGMSSIGWLGSHQSESNLINQVNSLQSKLAASQQTLNQSKTNLQAIQQQLNGANSQLSQLGERWVLFGGGTNRKYMLDPSTGQPTVPMDEVFSFDSNYAMCRVDNNRLAFAMQTYSMGKVTVDANSFYMLMLSEHLQIQSVTETGTGGGKAILTGSLHCTTAAGVAGVTVGSRTESEPATFEVYVVDDPQGEGQSFAFTGLFSKDQAPVNYAVFGPNATFTGKLTMGEVVVRKVKNL